MHPENFPNLGSHNYRITSPFTWDYNCIAWAIGESDTFYSSGFGYYWPRRLPTNMHDFKTIVAFFATMGFQPVEYSDTSLKADMEKVALYAASGGRWRHVALQRANGKWTSKLGEHEDIEHDTAEALLGGEYESIVAVLARPRQATPHPSSSP